MTTLFYAFLPFGISLVVWIVVKIFKHENRLNMNQADINDLKNLELGKIQSNHETRIKELENDRKQVNEKLDALTVVAYRIEGLLQSKKDKE